MRGRKSKERKRREKNILKEESKRTLFQAYNRVNARHEARGNGRPSEGAMLRLRWIIRETMAANDMHRHEFRDERDQLP